jgi:glycerophosphoryl diester phosphodiesterase
VISSFHEPVLRRAVQDAPDVPRAFIVDARATGDVAGIARSLSCEALHPDHRITDEGLVARCRAEGLKVRCWTVNAPQDVRRMTDLGVDAIVSDFPARVREMTR